MSTRSTAINPRGNLPTQAGQGFYQYNSITFRFSEPRIQAEFNEHMRTKAIQRGVLFGLFVYNVVGSPFNTKSLGGKYGLYGDLFTYSCISVHSLFFILFALEVFGSRWLEHASESHKKWYYTVRSLLMSIYVINGPATAGLAMNVRSRNPCLPDQVTFMEVFYCSTSPRGMIPVDTFVIGQMLALFQHFVFPIDWPTVIMAWFCELVLALLSVLPSATPQTFVTNTVFICVYVSTIALHHAVQTNVVAGYTRSRIDAESSHGSGGTAESLSLGEKSKVIENYLAELYHQQKTGRPLASHEHDMGSVDSSVSMSEFSAAEITRLSTISAHSKLRQRAALPKKKFLTQEKSLSVDTSVAGHHQNAY